MAHLVENMLAVGKAPWHGLGTLLDNPPTVEAAISLAGLDWRVVLEPLQLTSDGRPAPAHATVRDTDRRILGVVGPQYRPLQNEEAFAWFQPFLDLGEASIESAGSLAHGKRVWVLAKLSQAPLEVAPATPWSASCCSPTATTGRWPCGSASRRCASSAPTRWRWPTAARPAS